MDQRVVFTGLYKLLGSAEKATKNFKVLIKSLEVLRELQG